MSKNPNLNQTQFSSEDPLVHGRAELPPELIEPEEAARLAALSKAKKIKIFTIFGIIFVFLSALIWLLMSIPGPSLAPEDIPEEIVVTPTATDLTLREQIDQLLKEVDRGNRVSQSLVFPPVESEIRVEAR